MNNRVALSMSMNDTWNCVCLLIVRRVCGAVYEYSAIRRSSSSSGNSRSCSSDECYWRIETCRYDVTCITCIWRIIIRVVI